MPKTRLYFYQYPPLMSITWIIPLFTHKLEPCLKGSEIVSNRILKESIRISDDIDALSWFEEVLFYRLIVSCDDYGRYDGRAKIIKGTCFPLKDVTEKDIDKALNKLSAVGLVRVYKVQGRPYLQLITWEKHQRIRNKKSKYPPFDGACEQLLSNDSECQQTANNCGFNPIQSNVESESSLTVSNDTVCRTDIQRVVERWNSLESFGVKAVCKLAPQTKRYTALVARIKQYGIDSVLIAIDRIKQSDFLCGHNKKGWTITFDWFVLPSNFPKVLEGNYDNTVTQYTSNSNNTATNRMTTEEYAASIAGWDD